MTETHPPGRVDDLDTDRRGRWEAHLAALLDHSVEVGRSITGRPPWFLNVVTDPALDGAPTRDISWTAFPKRRPGELLRVDAERQLQDEYCEWEVARDDRGNLTRVTLTTETPDYYRFLNDEAPDVLLSLYHRFVSPEVALDDLRAPGGDYDATNPWNLGGGEQGTIMHMAQANNTLGAAATLAAVAGWPVVDTDGDPIVATPALVACLMFGDPGRHSDPHIGAQVNELVRAGHKVSLAEPVGLYLDRIDLSAFETPDGSSILDWHRVERGAAGHHMRVAFEAPEGSDHVLGDLRVDDAPLRFGGQVAEKARARLTGVAAPVDDEPPAPVVCGAVDAEHLATTGRAPSGHSQGAQE